MSLPLQRLNNFKLVLGGNPRIDGGFSDGGFKLFHRQFAQVLPCEQFTAGNTQILSNVLGREGVVARNHHHLNTGGLTEMNGLINFRASRVHQPHHAKKHKLLFEFSRFTDVCLGGRRQGAKRQPQYPQSLIGKTVVGRINLLKHVIAQGLNAMVKPDPIHGGH